MTSKGTIIPVSGTTPFARDFHGQAKGHCGGSFGTDCSTIEPGGFSASIQKSAPGRDVLTVCVTDRDDQRNRQCANATGSAPAVAAISF
jgi:hypothetical protein